MNDNQTNGRLAQAAQVKRVFNLLDIIDNGQDFVEVDGDEVDGDECGACFALRAELNDLLRSLGVEVER